jgi:leucyl-tRNA synthetase
MLVGDFKGVKVKDAEPRIKDFLIRQGFAVQYREPEEEVISRSGDKCVVALKDQWYFTYGEPEWKAQTEEYERGRV